MPDLPYDIVFLILKQLKLLEAQQHVRSRRYSRRPQQPTKFSAFATLSRAWNFAAERETFQTLHVFDDNIPESLRGGPITTTRFKQMMSRDAPRRRQIPRRIVYYASTQSELDSNKAMTEQGRKANDQTDLKSVYVASDHSVYPYYDEEFQYMNLLAPTLFWPSLDEPDAAQLPNWPLLEEYYLKFAPIDPHGRWNMKNKDAS
ncbi:hypothetical protein SLS55_010430 [Diplodia seriata]|uniref:F-box domain-containing protein n=1 Tax=Diplodia seriata TaxID=420778 RepID=A0ABR3BYH7_9PEZI